MVEIQRRCGISKVMVHVEYKNTFVDYPGVCSNHLLLVNLEQGNHWHQHPATVTLITTNVTDMKVNRLRPDRNLQVWIVKEY